MNVVWNSYFSVLLWCCHRGTQHLLLKINYFSNANHQRGLRQHTWQWYSLLCSAMKQRAQIRLQSCLVMSCRADENVYMLARQKSQPAWHEVPQKKKKFPFYVILMDPLFTIENFVPWVGLDMLEFEYSFDPEDGWGYSSWKLGAYF